MHHCAFAVTEKGMEEGKSVDEARPMAHTRDHAILTHLRRQLYQLLLGPNFGLSRFLKLLHELLGCGGEVWDGDVVEG